MDEVIQFEPLNNGIICHGISIRHYQSARQRPHAGGAHQGHGRPVEVICQVKRCRRRLDCCEGICADLEEKLQL